MPRGQGRVDADKPLAPMTWVQRLKRVFAIDIETCPHCGSTLRVIACIEEPALIARILGHVQQREELGARATALQAKIPMVQGTPESHLRKVCMGRWSISCEKMSLPTYMICPYGNPRGIMSGDWVTVQVGNTLKMAIFLLCTYA